MWTSPQICVYDWSTWRGFLIRAIWPKARRIKARFGEAPEEIAQRLPRRAKLLLIHFDISITSPFIPDMTAFAAVLRKHNVQVLNSPPPDIRKRTLQSLCRTYGLPTVGAQPSGPPDELLIVKTDFNAGGRREKLLTPAQRARFELPLDAGPIKDPKGYYVRRRAELSPDIWRDPTLQVERFVKNPLDRFFRVYSVRNSVVISEAYSDGNIKRMEGPIRRYNHFLRRDGWRISSASTDATKVPARLLEVAGMFLDRFALNYGAVDFAECESGEFYPVDLNCTPFWGREKQAGMIEHLRLGLFQALAECGS